MKRKLLRLFLPIWMLAIGMLAGYFGAQRDMLSRLFAPSHETARSRVERFIRAELTRDLSTQWTDSASIAEFCTGELQQLIQIELARERAFYEGYQVAQSDPLHALKPPFADSPYFVGVGREGKMSALAAPPIPRDEVLEIPISFTSIIDGRTYDQGAQTAIVRLEAGEWRIADIIYSDGSSLVRLLRRPKFMELPMP